MPLGDSVTEGDYFPSGVVGVGSYTGFPGGYRQNFYSDLTAAGDSFKFIGSQTVNSSPTLTAAGESEEEGHPGFTSTNLYGAYGSLYDNMPSYFSGADSSPNDVLLMIGTNDVVYSYQNGLSVNPNLVTADPLRIFQLDPTAHLFWSTIPPSPSNMSINASTVTYNSWITADAATLQSEGYDVTLVDAYSNMLNPDGSVNQAMFADNEHPSQLGYDTIGNTFAAAVLSSVPEPTMMGLVVGVSLVVRRRRI